METYLERMKNGVEFYFNNEYSREQTKRIILNEKTYKQNITNLEHIFDNEWDKLEVKKRRLEERDRERRENWDKQFNKFTGVDKRVKK